MYIHARLKWAHEKRGYGSAREAADALGVRYSTYAGHESGSRGIKREAVRRYARFFRVSPAWLEFGTGGDEAQTETADEKKTLAETPSAEGAGRIQFISSSFVEPARVAGFIQAGIWVDPSIVLEERTTGEGVSAIAGKWAGLPQFSYIARDNSADQLRISDGDYVLCVPYERARGGRLHDRDIVVIERVCHGGAFERTIRQIVSTGSKCALVSRSSEPRYPSIEINAKTMTEKDGTTVRIVWPSPCSSRCRRTDSSVTLVGPPGPLIADICGFSSPGDGFCLRAIYALCIMQNAGERAALSNGSRRQTEPEWTAHHSRGPAAGCAAVNVAIWECERCVIE